jgi:adenylosuccinate synthase
MTKWFQEPGAYVLVDGQFGSTGKGLLAGWLAERPEARGITHVTTNAGPNSGHTAYFQNTNHDTVDKIVTQQVPIASVFLERLGHQVETVINAGAIIDPDILAAEVHNYLDFKNVRVHPNAALISQLDKMHDMANVERIASTGKGIGPAQIAKLERKIGAVAYGQYGTMLPGTFNERSWDNLWDWSKDVVFVETAQGFSLGINSSRFYPNVTSRECTVMQAIADARIPAQMVRKVVACYRTYPIRVGNTQNSSGGCYEDQRETTWEELGLEPELTTVTKRVRRVFTWSRIQFRESVAVNRPNVIFINFLNYIENHGDRGRFLEEILLDYKYVMGHPPQCVLGGYGPYSRNIGLEYGSM